MAFIDNSGSIILDAVLTDAGRELLAKGDGSFKIAKVAFFDNEVDYGLYDKDHASGSAYYDLDILQTPVLEAFTNNSSYGGSHLITYSRNNLLYLPVVALNTIQSNTAMTSSLFVVGVDEDTESALADTGSTGILYGYTPEASPSIIRVDQGLDTTEISPKYTLDPDLVETQYTIEMDNRLGSIVTPVGDAKGASVSYVDDDNMASYYFTMDDVKYLVENEVTTDAGQVIDGPRGTILSFRIKSSLELSTSEYLFDTIGTSGASGSDWEGYKYIDSNVRVSGNTTGAVLNIPVRFVKKV